MRDYLSEKIQTVNETHFYDSSYLILFIKRRLDRNSQNAFRMNWLFNNVFTKNEGIWGK